MINVALTGNIASGKSEAALRFARRGARIIDADVLARLVVEPGEPALDEIVARWGKAVTRPDGSLDRAALRDIVFSDSRERAALNAIVHPRVDALRRAQLEEARRRGDTVVISDIPLLFENDLAAGFDRVVLVDAPESMRLRRLMEERGLSEPDARAMMAAQLPSSLKRAKSDFVIDNDGTIESLDQQVDAVWRALTARAR